ncbi:putative transglutaminase-like cysteine proteinase [Afipia massiliensis]|uniref:Putative transglutaminase-like cysteine proteinase n=1 Tax=Afipia massiliensis TaxID=211460 RepID=A0A840NER3_9BRAD|nr:transglutaminase-like cysteine peptidase [Afipia massiliensis]MBB5055176.1 putative transglutaminase-like cysteine proteinase [Afipia massiliensis]
MVSFPAAHAVTGAVICLAVLTASAFPSEAASKAKPRKHIFDDLVTPSMLTPPSPPVRVQAEGAHFFSINSILAKLDGKPKTEQPIRLASVTNDDVLSDASSELVAAESTIQATNEPFGLFTFRAPEGALWRKWRASKAEIFAELQTVEACRSDSSKCSDAARRFILIVDEVQSRSGTARIETANRLINTAIRYMSDLAQHAAIDVWSAPLASLGTGRGDCEDYAIAKYIVLREAGVSDQDLRILLVRDRKAREDHAVLTVRTGGTWTVLDNRSSALARDSELLHFTPLFVLDNSGVNLFASPYLSQRQDGEAKMVAPASEAVGSEGATTEWGLTVDTSGAETPISGIGSGATTLPILM